VVAEKFGGADLDQRIVDLEVEDLLDASLGQLRQRPAGLEGRQRAAVPIGAEGDWPRSASRILPVRSSMAGIVPWQKTRKSVSGRPKFAFSAKNLRVSRSVAGLTIR